MKIGAPTAAAAWISPLRWRAGGQRLADPFPEVGAVRDIRQIHRREQIEEEHIRRRASFRQRDHRLAVGEVRVAQRLVEIGERSSALAMTTST